MSEARKPGKWFIALDPGMPAEEAAQRVLNERFTVIGAAMDVALVSSEQDADSLRRLRVATRRGAEAAIAFRSLLDPASMKTAKRRLRMVRRSAGAVRDFDLVTTALRCIGADRAAKGLLPAIEHCLDHAHTGREAAHRDFMKKGAKRAAKLERARHELHDSIRTPGQPTTARDVAAPALAGFGDRLASIADQRELSDPHELRIELKKLKYTLELFLGCAEDQAALRGAHADLAHAQDLLGEMNDAEELALWIARRCAEAGTSERAPELSASFSALSERLDDRAEELRRSVREWWVNLDGRRFVSAIAHECSANIDACADGGNPR